VQKKAIGGVPWTVLSYAGGRGISILTTLVLARLVAPADFGLLALATLATNFLYWVADMGFSSALVLDQELDDRGKGTLLTLITLSGVVAGLIALALSPVAAAVFDAPRLEGVLAVTAAGLPLGSLAGFWGAILQREFEFKARFYGGIAQAVVAAAISIPLAALGAGVWSLVIGQLASTVAQLVINMTGAPYRVRPCFDRGMARTAIATGRGFVSQGLSGYLRQQVDTVTVGAAFGTRQVGFYSMANRLGDLVYWVLGHPIAIVTFPSFAKQRSAGEDVRPSFLRVLATVTLVACPVGIIMSATAEPFTRVLFGDRWLPMAGPLAILGLWAAARQLDTTISWFLNSIGRAGAAAWLSMFVLVPLVIGCVIAAQVGSLTTVALVPLADTLLSAALGSQLAQRFAQLGYAAQWRAVRPAVLASGPTWLAAWGVGRLLGPQHALLGFPLGVAAGVAVYATAISLIAPGSLGQVLGQLARMLGRGGADGADLPEGSDGSRSRDPYLRRSMRHVYRRLAGSPARVVLRLPGVQRVRARVNATQMTAAEALEIVAGLRRAGVETWLAGGWGVDALVGRQTREHPDLDLIVNTADEAVALKTLAEQGFAVYDQWTAGLLDRVVHVVKTRPRRLVDVCLVPFSSEQWLTRMHEVAESEGQEVPGLFARGVIDGQPVPCLSIEAQLVLHAGYTSDEEDRLDVALLCERFSRQRPHSYGSRAGELSETKPATAAR
jgi:lipopolysaccharide exporter